MDSNDKSPDFRIRNCTAADFEFACPKAWTNMKPGFGANVRHCDACDRNVYICHTDKDLALYTSLNYCVAIPATEADGPVPPQPSHTDAEPIDVIARFSGLWRRESAEDTVRELKESGMETYNVPEFLRSKKDIE